MTDALAGQTPTIADRVRASVAATDPRRSLRPDSVRFLRTVALSVGIQGPTAGVIVGPAVLAGIVGGAGALAYRCWSTCRSRAGCTPAPLTSPVRCWSRWACTQGGSRWRWSVGR